MRTLGQKEASSALPVCVTLMGLTIITLLLTCPAMQKRMGRRRGLGGLGIEIPWKVR